MKGGPRRLLRAVLSAGLLAALAAGLLVGVRRLVQPPPAPTNATDAPVSAAVTDALRLIARLETAGESPSNVVGRIFNARGKSAADFRKALDALPGHSRHVWMPGADRWFLVGHLTTNRVPLAAAMEAFADLQTARYSPTDVFAAYVGTVEDVLPAFASDLAGDVLPEWFVTKDIPAIDWLDTSGIDADICERTLAEIRSAQVVRREVLKGNMAAREAKDRAGERAACEIWARCMLRNPRDPLLLERLERLERNARGFLEVGKLLQAMKCYETMILIQPTNAAAVHNFGLCLKRLGKKDMAEQVLKRAAALGAP